MSKVVVMEECGPYQCRANDLATQRDAFKSEAAALRIELDKAKADLAAALKALDAVDSTLSECRYSFEVGRPLPCNCDIHAAHKIIDAARAGGGR